MSAPTNQPPSYDDHANFQMQPPQNFQYAPQNFQQPAVVTVPPSNFHTVPHVTVVTQQPSKCKIKLGQI